MLIDNDLLINNGAAFFNNEFYRKCHDQFCDKKDSLLNLYWKKRAMSQDSGPRKSFRFFFYDITFSKASIQGTYTEVKSPNGSPGNVNWDSCPRPMVPMFASFLLELIDHSPIKLCGIKTARHLLRFHGVMMEKLTQNISKSNYIYNIHVARFKLCSFTLCIHKSRHKNGKRMVSKGTEFSTIAECRGEAQCLLFPHGAGRPQTIQACNLLHLSEV